MHLSVDQPGLLHAVRLLGRVVPARATLPILKNLLVTAEPGRLVLRASNVELSVGTALAADVAAPGQVTIPSGPVAEWVAELPAERLVLRLDPATQRVQARCGRYTAQFATLPVDEFPTLPTADPNTAMDLASAPLRAAIRRVVFAAPWRARTSSARWMLRVCSAERTAATGSCWRPGLAACTCARPATSGAMPRVRCPQRSKARRSPSPSTPDCSSRC